jgi:NitT/TauT family transport system ATP-binding protein
VEHDLFQKPVPNLGSKPEGKLFRDHAPVQLKVEHVCKHFALRGRAGALDVLDDINLEIAQGELIVLLGPSGCGKSTLLNIIAGFMPPSAGRILHDGVAVSRPDRRRTVVFQDYALFPWMTVQKNVEFGLKAQAVEAAERARIAREFLALVKLRGFEDRYPYEISGGMKQRAAIARALAPDPDILLMDEPFGALDAQTRVLLQEELARIAAAAKRTVLFVTHSIEEAAFLADRIVVMSAHPGRVRSIHDVQLPRPRTAKTRSLADFITLTQELWDSLKPQWRDEKENAALRLHT